MRQRQAALRLHGGVDGQPGGLPVAVERCLTMTADGRWVVWAHKVAFREGEGFHAITGDTYPDNARARCRRDPRHVAPVAACTCGFHAVSNSMAGLVGAYVLSRPIDLTPGAVGALGRIRRRLVTIGSRPVPSLLSVVLSGRILALEYAGRSALFRAERQTVVHVDDQAEQPGDPSGTREQSRPRQPMDVGPVRLELPHDPPASVAVVDDAGFCVVRASTVSDRIRVRRPERTPVTSS